MTTIRTAGIAILSGLLLVGCQSAKKSDQATTQPVAQPASADTRLTIQKANPKAIIGRVSAVLSADCMAAVAEIPADKLQAGDVVSFMGDDGVACVGVVKTRVGEAYHVQYNRGQRAPVVGDLAVRFPY